MEENKEKKEFVAPKLELQKIRGEQILAGSGGGSVLDGNNSTESITSGGSIWD